MKVHVLGIDLAKNVFQLHGVDRKGRPLLARRIRREQLLGVLGELEPCLIGVEASARAFHWQRQFEKLGHAVKIWRRSTSSHSSGGGSTIQMTPKRFARRSSNAICGSCLRRPRTAGPPGAPPRVAAAG